MLGLAGWFRKDHIRFERSCCRKQGVNGEELTCANGLLVIYSEAALGGDGRSSTCTWCFGCQAAGSECLIGRAGVKDKSIKIKEKVEILSLGKMCSGLKSMLLS